MLKHIKQEHRSRNCGQVCLAILSGKSPKEVEALINKSGATYTKDMIKGLKSLGYKPSSRLKLISKNVSLSFDTEKKFTALVKIKWNWATNKSHWILYHQGYIYDPGREDAFSLKEYKVLNGKMTSLLGITL